MESPNAESHDSAFLNEESVPLDRASLKFGLTGSDAAASSDDPDATEQISGPSKVGASADTNAAAYRDLQQNRLLALSPPVEPDEKAAYQKKHAPLQTGTVLAGRYVILEEVARNSTRQVYKALDRQRSLAGDLEPWVALKVASSDDARARHQVRLREEYRMLLRLRHPNIVGVYDLCRDGNTEFIVLEWLSGQTLADLLGSIKSHRIALSTAKNIVTELAEALAFAHASGIVHGDIKPSNVFLTEDHSIRIIDFGASSLLATHPGVDEQPLWATRAYASCEVLLGNAPRTADDVFSLGVTAYRLFSGEWPFGEMTSLAAKDGCIEASELPDEALGCGLAVRQALQFDAIDRPSDAMAFVRLLGTETDKRDLPAKAIPFRIPQPKIIGSGLAAMAVALAVILLWPESEPAPSAVDNLLAKADAAFVGGQLLEPIVESAFDRYQAILNVDPLNSVALERMDIIAEKVLDHSRLALKEERFDDALAYLAEARMVRPDHFGIPILEDLVGRYRRDLLVSARQVLAIDADLAEQYVSSAEALSAAEDVAIAAVRMEIEQERSSAELEILIRKIDERILSERLLVPKSDSALDLLVQAREIAADDWQVQLAADRITSALIFQAWFATSRSNFDAAQSFIDAAATLDVRHLALARAKYELVKSRNDAEQKPASDADVLTAADQ